MEQIKNTKPLPLDIRVYPKDLQTDGSFDGGRITETKPIPFPHEGPRVKSTGPLFYWAWATAKGYGKIGLHPHRGFEIISYALQGEIGHYDTLGNKSRVKTGGAQIMQTGSGVSHEEETLGDSTDFFQIWFEPDLRETLKQEPTYQAFESTDFPCDDFEGVQVKTVLGNTSPVQLETDVVMQDVIIPSARLYKLTVPKGKTLALVAVSSGLLLDDASGTKATLGAKDVAIVHGEGEGNGSLTLKAEGVDPFRFIAIIVPTQTDYPLYRDGL